MSSRPTTPSTGASTPPIPSTLYTTRQKTATKFITSLSYSPTSPAPYLNIPLILSLRTHNYTHTFGHNYFVSTAPPLQGTHDLDGFIAHITRMTALLESWDSEIRDLCVDEAARSVVVRVGYWMKVKGEEKVENDLIWWVWMDEEGRKVVRSVEFVDAAAGGEIKRGMERVRERMREREDKEKKDAEEGRREKREKGKIVAERRRSSSEERSKSGEF
jgi:hypothetical protein